MKHQWKWQILRSGAFSLDGGSMFGVVPKSIWSKLIKPDEQNRIRMQTNCLLLDDGSQKILIETGFGNKWTDKQRSQYEMENRCIVDALNEVNCTPEDINSVIVTHLHFDHAGGLTRLNNAGEAIPTFPNAKIFVQQTEWEDALANKSTMTRTYLRNNLDPIADRLQLVDGEKEILPGIIAWPMVGHTWGQQALKFSDDKGIVCFPGDVMPTINHVGPAFNMGYDMLPYQNMLSKQQLLERAADEGWRIALDHEPGQAVVTVNRDPDRKGRFILNS